MGRTMPEPRGRRILNEGEEGVRCVSEGCLRGEVMDEDGNEEGDAPDKMRAGRPVLNTQINTENGRSNPASHLLLQAWI